MLSCKNFHMDIIETETENLKDDNIEKAEQEIDNENSDKNAKICQCGKQVKLKTFKCEKCGKFYCNTCPAGPIEDNSQCLPCLFKDYSILTSTPEKKQTEESEDIGTLAGPPKWTA